MTLLKYTKRLAGFTLLFSALMGTAAFASNVGTVTRDSINVRAGNSETSQVIGTTNTGDKFAILDVKPGWVKVQYPNAKEAYIASLYVKVSEADASVKDHAVNVRSGPSTSTQVIGQLNTGDKVSVVGKTADGAWYKVNYNNNTAYVSADYLGGNYLYLVQPDKTQAVAATTNTQPVVAVTTANENTTNAPALSVEDILKTFAPADDNTYATIKTPGGLRLRSQPSTSSDNTILTVIADGNSVTVDEVGEGWLKVSDDYGNNGYISSEFVEVKQGEKPTNSGKLDTSSITLQGGGAEIAEYALKFLGTPYVYGGTDLATGVDCSGFVYSIYKNFGITLQRNSASQYTQGTYVDKSNLQAGDLIFFNTGGNTNISHVGMYLGDNKYIHSSTYSTGVIVEDLYDDYSTSTYVGAKRII